MNVRIAALAVLLLVPTAAWPQCQVIDDFTTGKYRVRLDTPNATTTNYADPKRAQTGTMLGGVRVTAFLVAGNPFGQPGELNVAKSGPQLVISEGTRQFFRLDMQYGQDTNFNNVPLGYSPTGCDRFRVTFDSNSRVLNFNTLVFSPGTTYYQLGINMDASPSPAPFCVDFPFDNFIKGGTSTKGLQNFAGDGIDFLDFIFQSGSAIGANDFAVTKIETVSPATAIASPCTFVAP